MSVEQQLARRYAKAWLAVYPKALNFESLERLVQAYTFYSKHPPLGFHLKLSVTSDRTKKELLAQLISSFDLPSELNKLVTLLIKHKRSFLFAVILREIESIYKKNNRIQTFIFSSPVVLDEQYCKEIQRFLAAKTGCVIIYEKRIDSALIAGIRLQSTTFLWECSIAQQLRVLRQALT